MAKLFSELWEEAESISSGMGKEELCLNLIDLITEYKKLDNIASKDIQGTLKKKKYGEILQKMTELSKADDINVYAALQLETDFLKKLNQS